MNRKFYTVVLPYMTLACWELAGVVVAVQVMVWFTEGRWMSGTLGDILMGMGFSAPPADWMGGSVYDWLWNQSLAITGFAAGWLALTYSAVITYDLDAIEGEVAAPIEAAMPAVALPVAVVPSRPMFAPRRRPMTARPAMRPAQGRFGGIAIAPMVGLRGEAA